MYTVEQFFFFLSGVSLLPLGGDLDGFCSPCQS